jgi:hypothetical protein
MLSPKERLTRQARGLEVDRVPTLGGWIGGAETLADLAGLTVEEYLRDPPAGLVRAHLALGVDGMVGPVVPRQRRQLRTGAVTEASFPDREPEDLVARAEALPDDEHGVLAGFDAAAAERVYREHFLAAFRDWRGIVPVSNFWELGGPFPLYTEFGYVAFLSACALYPEAVGKIWWTRSVVAREKAKILARLYRELDLVPLLFCGEDLCNNQGPLVAPEMLRAHYFPHVRRIVEPLVDAGVRLVHHCDGDVRPLVDDFIGLGFSGLQGFQYELGIDLRAFAARRSLRGESLLLFTGLSVTRTLPFGTPDDVRAEVDYFHDVTGGGAGMFLFTSNVTGIDVPPENLRAAYARARERPAGRPAPSPRREWPGLRVDGG